MVKVESKEEVIDLLKDGLQHIMRVHPFTIQEPVRNIFRAAIERVERSPSILGLPIIYELELAQALKDDC